MPLLLLRLTILFHAFLLRLLLLLVHVKMNERKDLNAFEARPLSANLQNLRFCLESRAFVIVESPPKRMKILNFCGSLFFRANVTVRQQQHF